MSGNVCSCSGPSAPLTPPTPSSGATPCGSGAFITPVIWDPLSLPASTQQTSQAVSMRGGNALEFTAIGIYAAGAIQTSLQAQVSINGTDWTNAGSALQITALGYSASTLTTGIAFNQVRFLASNSESFQFIFTLVARIFCG